MNSIVMTKACTGLHFFNILQLLFPLLVMESLRRMRRCAHVAWFALGICLAILISWILKRRECKDSDSERGCILREESVRQQVCHANNTSNTASVETSSSSLMAVLFSLSGALIGIIGIALIVAVAFHLHEKRHGSYRRLIKSALLHQTRCHASVPEKRQNWKPLRWQASVSCKDLRKIFCLDLDMVNISGVGLTLYRATMVLFLATAVLCRVGNDISERFFVYISADWCTDRLSPDQAATLWRDLAEERALALTRLYIIISLLHLYHLYRQGGRRDDFDRLHAEMSDYAYLASGFPESASQKDIMEYFSRSLRSFNVEGRIRWRPEIIGISIGYDYRANLKLVQNLVEEHLIDVAARLQPFEAPEFSESSGSDSESETSMNSMPVSPAQQRTNALEMMGHDTGDNVLEVLRSLPNSGTVVVVWRWPCESVEILEEMQECLDNNQWEGADGTRRIQVMPIPCEPPSMIWTNFAAHLFERPGKEAAFFCSEKKLFLTGRQKQILVANVLIVSAFVIMLVFYYFLYKMVYGKGRHPEQILTTIVTCCCAVGNVLLNQLVWFASQQVGYRVKTHCDAFVLTWYALVVFTNMGFNFFVICWDSWFSTPRSLGGDSVWIRAWFATCCLFARLSDFLCDLASLLSFLLAERPCTCAVFAPISRKSRAFRKKMQMVGWRCFRASWMVYAVWLRRNCCLGSNFVHVSFCVWFWLLARLFVGYNVGMWHILLEQVHLPCYEQRNILYFSDSWHFSAWTNVYGTGSLGWMRLSLGL